MKRLPYILLISIFYFLFCGKSCVDDSEREDWQQKRVTEAKDTIRSEFETGHLSEEACFAAEVKAIQDVNDLADYVEIYSDRSLNILFRQKAAEMIREMFISEDASLSFGKTKNHKMKSVTLDEFLRTGFGDDSKKAQVIFDSIRVQKPLQKYDGSTYSGELASYQTIILHPLADNIISSSNQVTIHFISSKQVKIIGQDTLKVWEVKIGDLEVVILNKRDSISFY
ncbi:MAG: hypothetical protein MUC31_00075 [Bacteroidales bacterium]|jgi:hypothetical protein|nr:hypothetical protein [Bacteroidales bacterium]